MPLNSTRGGASAKGFGLTVFSGKSLVGARGVTAGGTLGGTGFNEINFFTIATAGNATDFGDLTNSRTASGGVGSLTRAVFGAGSIGNTPDVTNVMDFITIASTGNAIDFGDFLSTTYGLGGTTCNGTRGIFGGGYIGPATNVIQFITIASAGNATDFGDLTVATYQNATAISSPTRGVFAGGWNQINVIQFITIASAGNATDFGDLLSGTTRLTGTSDATRGVIGGGIAGSAINVIQFITIASAGNSIDFGDLIGTNYTNFSATSNSLRGIFTGGRTGGGGGINVLQFITIQSTGNATDFGDLTYTCYNVASTSNGTGGLN